MGAVLEMENAWGGSICPGDVGQKYVGLDTSGQVQHILYGHAQQVIAVAVTPDGRVAVSGSLDRTLKVWDIESGRELQTLGGHAAFITAVAISSDGRRALSASADTTVRVWDLTSGEQLLTFAGHTESVTGVAVVPDGQHALSCSWDGSLAIWSLETGAIMTALSCDYPLLCCAVGADGTTIVAGDQLGHLHSLRLERV